MGTAVLMNHGREKIFVDSSWIEANAELIDFVKAKDGVWVPKCDLAQYELGKRPFRRNKSGK